FGRRISYHVDLEPLQNPELYFSGTPEFLDLRSRVLYRSYADVYTLGKPLTEGFRYDASSLLEDPPERTTPLTPAPVLSLAQRSHNLQLPPPHPRTAQPARPVPAPPPPGL